MNSGIHPKVLLLAGGQGSRLASLFPNHAKALVPFGQSCFLDILLPRLRREGLRDFVLLTGKFGQDVALWQSKHASDVITLQEPKPRGTGGAVIDAILALQIQRSFLVLNADTWWLDSLEAFFARGLQKGEDACLLAAPPSGESRYGGLFSGPDGWKFLSQSSEGALRYAGAAWLNPQSLKRFTCEGEISLETEIFPELVRLAVEKISEDFFDYGTPDSYRRLAQYFQRQC